MPTLTNKEVQNICESQCEQHGVNTEFFFNKIKALSPTSENEVLALLDEQMLLAFETNYDEMYEGITTAEAI